MHMAMRSPPNAACAACKFQRRKCTAECLLAPWFPPDQPKRFANVHKLFGVSNVLKLFTATEGSKREDLVSSIIYEADARERDPVHGAYGIVQLLERAEGALVKERDKLRYVYEAMLIEEAKQTTKAVYLLQSSAAQLNSLGAIGGVGGGPSTPYLQYSPSASTGSLWDLQSVTKPSAAAHSFAKQPQQADWMSPCTYSGHGSSGSMYTNAQQLHPPPQPLQQFHCAPELQLHSENNYSAKANSMQRSKFENQQYVRDFLSQGLGSTQSFFL